MHILNVSGWKNLCSVDLSEVLICIISGALTAKKYDCVCSIWRTYGCVWCMINFVLVPTDCLPRWVWLRVQTWSPLSLRATDAISHVTFFCISVQLPCFHFCACSLVPVFMPERLSSTGGFNYREGSIDKLKVEGEWQVKAVIARGWLRLRHQRLLDPENSFWQMHLLRSCRVAVGGWWHSLAQPTQTRLPAPHWANLKSILMPQALSCIMTCKKQKPSQYAWYQTVSQ